ncbi:rod shape-determining protein MreC [Candidatus Parcubacteria bacterium]|nr:rod shape-determining protein MreC [Candidatus Parcubacteria bacterium]
MRYSISKFIISILVLFIALAGLNVWLLKNVRVTYGPLRDSQASLFSLAGQMREWAQYLEEWRSLANQVQDLTSERDSLKGQVAQLDATQQENEFLRKALDIQKSLSESLVPGGIYAINMGPGSSTALINKGSNNRISKGDVVITPERVLVGEISEVYTNTAKVTLVNDPTFKISIRVMAGEVHGIAKGSLEEGMNLQLIVQTDQISEGDALVSSGDDFFPAGLIVGNIRHIEANETQLFKRVSIVPSFQGSNGSILIIHQ